MYFNLTVYFASMFHKIEGIILTNIGYINLILFKRTVPAFNDLLNFYYLFDIP